MKNNKLGLLPKIIIAIILGAVAGLFAPAWTVRFFVTLNGLFSQFLNFIIPLIILGLVVPAIADIGHRAGKMLLATTIIAYAATLFSGYLAYGVGAAVYPNIITASASLEEIGNSADVLPYFTVNIPAPLEVMTALVLAFVLGIGLAHLENNDLKNICQDFKQIIEKTILNVIIPLLPYYIFGIFMNMAHSGQIYVVITTFIKIIGIIFLLHIFLLLLQYTIAGVISGKNPLKLLWNMLPAYFTALGTQSSAATIPVTLKRTMANGVSEQIAGFVIPLCATIHLSGSTLKIVSCAIALMIMQGIGYDFMTISGFIFMLGIVMVAAPGVPGGAIMASLGVLSSMLGFSENDQALMIALYIAMDSFGTACNVTGDGAIALIIERFFGGKEENSDK